MLRSIYIYYILYMRKFRRQQSTRAEMAKARNITRTGRIPGYIIRTAEIVPGTYEAQGTKSHVSRMIPDTWYQVHARYICERMLFSFAGKITESQKVGTPFRDFRRF